MLFREPGFLSKPIVHWSFDDGSAFADATGGHPASDGEVSRFQGLENAQAFGRTEGRFGQGLAATGTVAQAQSGWPGVAENGPRTIAHWIKLSPGGPETQVVVGWGSHALTPFHPNPAFLTYLWRRTGETVVGVSFGSYFLNGATPVDDDRWHHFAVVYTGRQLADGTPDLVCYLDGRPEPMSPSFRADIVSPDEPGALSIRTAHSVPEAINLTLFPTNWDLRRSSHMPLSIDELYIFESALEEEQIKNLYQHNQFDYEAPQ